MCVRDGFPCKTKPRIMRRIESFFKHIALTFVAVVLWTTALADGTTTFEVNTPMMVAAGEMFRVEFTLTNGDAETDSFKAPDFGGLEVLAGPVVSTGHSMHIVNGNRTTTTTMSISYTVVAQKEGNITIGAAEILSDGKSYKTKPTPIEVVKQDTRQQEAAASQGSTVQNQLAEDDILLKMNLSRSTVYKGEPIRASLTLYTRANIAGFENVKLPSFNGFWSQELPTDNYQAQRVNENGKIYNSQIIKEYLLYPQQTGPISIESTDLTAIAQVVVRSSRNFDPFFGGGNEVYNVRRSLSTGKIAVTVNELPQGAPASFKGAVGSFTLTSTPPASELKANSAATYTVRITGTGNFSFIQAPTLSLPTSFEQYNIRNTESLHSTTAGMTGYRQFEYPFIARAEGDYTIAPIEFTYFSPERGEYITLSTNPIAMKVSPDTSAGATQTPQVVTSASSKEDVRQLGSDIRFIKLSRAALRSSTTPLMFSSTYFIVLLLIVVLFVVAYFTLRRRIRDSKNTVLVRNRRANKVAVQRFRAAERFMREGNRHSFFEEMLRALWGYMGDKLNIPVADLTKESIREELQRRGIESAEAQHFTDIITRCDEAQYSPAESVQMSDVYSDGVNIISHIESRIKR